MGAFLSHNIFGGVRDNKHMSEGMKSVFAAMEREVGPVQERIGGVLAQEGQNRATRSVRGAVSDRASGILSNARATAPTSKKAPTAKSSSLGTSAGGVAKSLLGR